MWKYTVMLCAFSVLVFADEIDAEILKDLDFFSDLELVENIEQFQSDETFQETSEDLKKSKEVHNE